MKVRILFFGATADESGMRSLEVAVDRPENVGDALERLMDRFPKLRDHKLRFAVNQEYVSNDRTLNDGDELAVFTAVSGG